MESEHVDNPNTACWSRHSWIPSALDSPVLASAAVWEHAVLCRVRRKRCPHVCPGNCTFPLRDGQSWGPPSREDSWRGITCVSGNCVFVPAHCGSKTLAGAFQLNTVSRYICEMCIRARAVTITCCSHRLWRKQLSESFETLAENAFLLSWVQGKTVLIFLELAMSNTSQVWVSRNASGSLRELAFRVKPKTLEIVRFFLAVVSFKKEILY